MANETIRKVNSMTHKNPVRAIITGFGMGYLAAFIGRILSRRYSK